MSADLIERLTKPVRMRHRFGSMVEKSSPAIQHEAADALAAKDAALSEMRAELERARAIVECYSDEQQKQLADWKAEKAARIAAEAQLERARKALRCIAEGNLGDETWQANYAKIRDVAARALASQDEGRRAVSAPDEDQTIFYEVATLDGVAFAEPSFALVRIDASKRIGNGVEGVVMSRHWTRQEADDAAKRATNPHEGG